MGDRTTRVLRKSWPDLEPVALPGWQPAGRRPSSRWRGIPAVIAGILAVVRWTGGYNSVPRQLQLRAGSAPRSPTPVAADTAQTGDVDITLDALGTVTPLATVTVRTQINGQLTEVAFKEGQLVKKGDFLAQIDPRQLLPYSLAG